MGFAALLLVGSACAQDFPNASAVDDQHGGSAAPTTEVAMSEVAMSEPILETRRGEAGASPVNAPATELQAPAVAGSAAHEIDQLSIGGRFGLFGPVMPTTPDAAYGSSSPGLASEVVPDGSGCTVEGDVLPDGLWHGRVYVPASSFEIEFDLMCRYSDRSASTLLEGDDEATVRWHSVVGAALEVNDSSRRFTVPSEELAVVERSPFASGGRTRNLLRDDLARNWYPDGSALTTTPVWILVDGGLVREVHQIDEIDDINRTVRSNRPDLDWDGDSVIVGRIHSLQLHGPAGPVVNVFRPDLYRPEISITDLTSNDLAPDSGATDCGPYTCGTAVLEQYRVAPDVVLYSMTAEAVSFACGGDSSGEFASEVFEVLEVETMPLGDLGTYLFDEDGRVASIYLSRSC